MLQAEVLGRNIPTKDVLSWFLLLPPLGTLTLTLTLTLTHTLTLAHEAQVGLLNTLSAMKPDKNDFEALKRAPPYMESAAQALLSFWSRYIL